MLIYLNKMTFNFILLNLWYCSQIFWFRMCYSFYMCFIFFVVFSFFQLLCFNRIYSVNPSFKSRNVFYAVSHLLRKPSPAFSISIVTFFVFRIYTCFFFFFKDSSTLIKMFTLSFIFLYILIWILKDHVW